MRTRGCKRVVVVLPVAGGRILMQLRDQKPGIDAPGRWGFLGGSILADETPRAAAERELFEEVGYRPVRLRRLGEERIRDLDRIVAVSYCCALGVPVESLRLTEGMDLGAKSLSEIRSGRIYSEKMRKYFPVVPTYFIEKMSRKALNLMEETT